MNGNPFFFYFFKKKTNGGADGRSCSISFGTFFLSLPSLPSLQHVNQMVNDKKKQSSQFFFPFTLVFLTKKKKKGEGTVLIPNRPPLPFFFSKAP